MYALANPIELSDAELDAVSGGKKKNFKSKFNNGGGSPTKPIDINVQVNTAVINTNIFAIATGNGAEAEVEGEVKVEVNQANVA